MYYFYVYNDPEVKNIYGIDVSIRITYHQKLNPTDNWRHISTYLEELSLFFAGMIVLTYYQHVYAQKFERAKKIYYSDYSINRACYNCRELVLERYKECPNCGTKLKD